jgi:site-specific DNA-methyltransferase (adenine-specific)
MTDNCKPWEIIHGDALKLLGSYEPGSFDAVITDPPYPVR